MTNEEIIKANAILILEQKKEIDRLQSLLNDISRELPEDYTDLEEEEDLPKLANYWVSKAKKLEERIENFEFKENVRRHEKNKTARSSKIGFSFSSYTFIRKKKTYV